MGKSFCTANIKFCPPKSRISTTKYFKTLNYAFKKYKIQIFLDMSNCEPPAFFELKTHCNCEPTILLPLNPSGQPETFSLINLILNDLNEQYCTTKHVI